MSAVNTLAVAGPIDWVSSALERISANDSAVLVMITEDAGSTPRDAGAWILVDREATLGTLGGGQLEQIAEDAANGRRILGFHRGTRLQAFRGIQRLGSRAFWTDPRVQRYWRGLPR